MIHRDTNTLTFFRCQDMAHVSCVLTHGSCVMRPASGSWLMRPYSVAFFIQRPLPVVGHDDNENGGYFSMLLFLDLRLLSYMAGGNRVVLPPPYSSTGMNKNSGRRSFKRRPLLLLNEKRPALMKAPAAVVAHTKKAGIMPALFVMCCYAIR